MWAQANCARAVLAGFASPDNWFPTDEDQLKTAVAFCEACPLKKMCNEYGTSEGLSGVWGGKLRGMSVDDGRRIIRPTRAHDDTATADREILRQRVFHLLDGGMSAREAANLTGVHIRTVERYKNHRRERREEVAS